MVLFMGCVWDIYGIDAKFMWDSSGIECNNHRKMVT